MPFPSRVSRSSEGSKVQVQEREPRAEKVAVVKEVQTRLADANGAILTEYRGLGVPELQTLRRALRAAGGEYKIYKNTLVRRAVQDSTFSALETLLVGPTAITFVRDDVAAVAKVLRDFSRTNPALVVKGGFIGADLLDAQTTAALADLPSRDVLLAQIAGALAAPMQRFAGLLAALPQKFAYGLSALLEQRGGVPEAVVAEAPAQIVAEAAPETAVPGEAVAEEVAPAQEPAEEVAVPVEAASEQAAQEEVAPAVESSAEEPAVSDVPDELDAAASADVEGSVPDEEPAAQASDGESSEES